MKNLQSQQPVGWAESSRSTGGDMVGLEDSAHPTDSGLLANTGVICDFVANQQSIGWFGDVIERAGPGMQVNLALVVQLAEGVVKLADAPRRGLAIQLRQRTIFRGAGVLPARQFGQHGILQFVRARGWGGRGG